MEHVFENSHGTCKYDELKKVIHYKFMGTVNPEKGIEVLQKTIEFSSKNQILGVHTDLTELKGTFTMLNDYLTNEYFPKMIEQGLKCCSMVLSEDIFTQFSTENLIQRMGTFTIRTFNNLSEGYNWVLASI